MTGIIMPVYGAATPPPPPPPPPTTPPPGPPPPPPPEGCTTQSAFITGISPSSGTAGSTTNISGSFPIIAQTGLRVTNVIFEPSYYTSFSASASSISVTVPNAPAGTYTVQVYNGCTPLLSPVSYTITSGSTPPTTPPPTTPPPTTPPPTTPPPTTPPPTSSGPCPAGAEPWYGYTCTATDAYWTGCTVGTCDMWNDGAQCLIACLYL